MMKFFNEGGVGMYPTAVFGLFFFALAILHALRPDRRLGPVVVLLGMVTVGAGLLGLCMGLSATTRAVVMSASFTTDERLTVLAQGTSESLNNLILAMMLLVPSGLVGAIAALRASGRPASVGA